MQPIIIPLLAYGPVLRKGRAKLYSSTLAWCGLMDYKNLQRTYILKINGADRFWNQTVLHGKHSPVGYH